MCGLDSEITVASIRVRNKKEASWKLARSEGKVLRMHLIQISLIKHLQD